MKDPRLLIKAIQKIGLPECQVLNLCDRVPLYILKSPSDPLFYMELVFTSGRITEHKKLASRFTADLLRDGSSSKSSLQIAEEIELYGSSLAVQADLDFFTIQLTCLHKFLTPLLEVLFDVLLNPQFPEEQIEKTKIYKLAQLRSQLTEPDYVSYRELTKILYSEEHPYGYNTEEQFIADIRREDLQQYHRESLALDNLQIFMVANNVDQHLKTIEKYLQLLPNTSYKPAHIPVIVHNKAATKHIAIASSTQTALRIGGLMFPRKHPDFPAFHVLNTILGDYFGSRLMQDIREKKAYTYDISSNLDLQIHAGCFYIGAELNAKFLQKTIEAIKDEIEKLQQELVSQQELELVKNYIFGSFHRMLDGNFQAITIIKILLTEYGGLQAYDTLIEKVQTITAEEIRLLAQQYLLFENMSIVTAGAGK